MGRTLGSTTENDGIAVFRSRRLIGAMGEDAPRNQAPPAVPVPDSFATASQTRAARTLGALETVYVLLDSLDTPSGAKVVTMDGMRYIYAFDTEERLLALAGEAAPRAHALVGELLDDLKGAGIGLALNVDDPANATIVPADTLDSIEIPARIAEPAAPPPEAGHEAVDQPASEDRPDPQAEAEVSAPDLPPEPDPASKESAPSADASNAAPVPGWRERLIALMQPREFPDTVLVRLIDSTGGVAHLCERAILFRAQFESGEASYLVGLSGVADANRAGLEEALANALEARRDLGLGIAYLDEHDPALERVARVGIDLKAARRPR